MNTALIADAYAAQPVRPAPPLRLAAWLQRIADAWAAPAEARTDLREMNPGATLWVARPRGCIVSCRTGTLWLTFDNEPQDVILEAGQSHRCTSTGKLSIHAMTAAAVSVA